MSAKVQALACDLSLATPIAASPRTLNLAQGHTDHPRHDPTLEGERPSIIASRTPSYRRISAAFFLAGFATFSLIYCVQPLLVAFTHEFGVGAAQSSLALSLTTGFLAASILLFGAGAENFRRRDLMVSAMVGASLLNIASALAPHWAALLTARALEGCMLGGVPAVAMAYLADEIEPSGLGLAMGLYVAGTAFGGMAGRVGAGMLSDITSWRAAIVCLSVVDLIAAAGFCLLLPPALHSSQRRGFEGRRHCALWATHLRNRFLRNLFLMGFLLMGVFVTVYNYAAFRLIAPPFNLSQGQVSLIFLTYLFGIGASSIAGAMADRYGRGPVLTAGVVTAFLGLALMLFSSFAAVIAGISVLTIGFFMSHSVASGWVGQSAGSAKGHATSLYLLAYYSGSSLLGSAGGWVWAAGGWAAVSGFASLLLLAGFATALNLTRLEKLVPRTAT